MIHVAKKLTMFLRLRATTSISSMAIVIDDDCILFPLEQLALAQAMQQWVAQLLPLPPPVSSPPRKRKRAGGRTVGPYLTIASQMAVCAEWKHIVDKARMKTRKRNYGVWSEYLQQRVWSNQVCIWTKIMTTERWHAMVEDTFLAEQLGTGWPSARKQVPSSWKQRLVGD